MTEAPDPTLHPTSAPASPPTPTHCGPHCGVVSCAPPSVLEKRWFHYLMAFLIALGLIFHVTANSAASARKSSRSKD